MKTRWMALLAAGALGGGCVPNNFVAPAKPPATADKSAEAGRPAYHAAVTAGQITGNNAHEKAQALRDEIDADTIAAIEAGDKEGGGKKKE